jgi:hypothetical protein
MAHTDRQPTDDVFKDIKQAADLVWWRSDHIAEYIQEKVDYRKDVVNYADNWCGFVQQFDTTNQILFFENLMLQASVDFLRVQGIHYSYYVPRIKK